MQVEVREDGLVGLRARSVVGERDVAELDVALGCHEVDSSRPIDDVCGLVEDLVDPLGRGRRPLAEHGDHAEDAEGRLEHHHIAVEGDDRADGDHAVDGEPPAVQQHCGEAETREVLHEGRVASPRHRGLHRRPSHTLRGVGELVDLGLLGGERSHDAHAVHVLVDDRRDVGHARLHDPRERERLVPHLDARDVHERDRGERDERQADVDREHEDQGDGEAHEVERDERCEGQEHLH